MSAFDYDVIVIGSGFGGSVTGPATDPLGVHELRELDSNIQARV